MKKGTFIHTINQLGEVQSVQGKTYRQIEVIGERVAFVRGHKTTREYVHLDELLALYTHEPHFNNTIAKGYISGRVQSPAVSILNAIKNGGSPQEILRNEKPAQLLSREKSKLASKQKTERKSAPKDKDETRFFIALAKVLGEQFLLSKGIGKPVTGVFYKAHYKDYDFPTSVNQNYKKVLTAWQSNFAFGSKSLIQFLDGFILNHPRLGTRMVEFDEEQHFTPALKDIIQSQSLVCKKYYLELLNDQDYFSQEVLKKNRIRKACSTMPQSFKEFKKWLTAEQLPSSGYIKEKENGFPFLGGRIAQRAYYDSLRNVAHLSPHNQGVRELIRFPKKYFEQQSGSKFGKLAEAEVAELIRKYLREVYEIEIMISHG